ncbi:Mu-type opioid receptor [Ameca splendens]|uniref:Mu-type opioid receptor n=1 Tax=Ameca splendens TaxID=208324 RepID=A0ABV1A710_9TELE
MSCWKLVYPVTDSCRYTKMKTATNIYIFNLALADTLVTSTLPFQSVNYLMGTWPFGDMLCKMVMSIDYYNMFTSIFTLTTMSIDRYIAVCHPVKALDFRTPRNAKIVNVCNWILSSAIGLPVMFMASSAVTRKHEHMCAIRKTLVYEKHFIYKDKMEDI